VIVLARLVPSHMAGQGIGRYIVCEHGLQEADRRWVASVGDAVYLDQRQVWRIVGCRTSLLAEAHPSIRVCSYSAASHFMVHFLRSRMGICYCTLVGGDRQAGPRVSLIVSDGYSWYLQVRVCSHCALPGLAVVHWSLHVGHLWSGGRHGGVQWMVAKHGLCDMVIMDVHRKPSAEWQKDERVSMMRGGKCECGGWVGMRGEKRVRNACPWRRRVAVLENHRGQVGHRDGRGMVGRNGIARIGWYHHCD